MKKEKIQTINVHELQAKASQVVKDASEGTVFEIVRYSQPQAVIIPYKGYEKLKGSCHKCVEEIKTIVNKKFK